jgi:hypothetical protein
MVEKRRDTSKIVSETNFRIVLNYITNGFICIIYYCYVRSKQMWKAMRLRRVVWIAIDRECVRGSPAERYKNAFDFPIQRYPLSTGVRQVSTWVRRRGRGELSGPSCEPLGRGVGSEVRAQGKVGFCLRPRNGPGGVGTGCW